MANLPTYPTQSQPRPPHPRLNFPNSQPHNLRLGGGNRDPSFTPRPQSQITPRPPLYNTNWNSSYRNPNNGVMQNSFNAPPPPPPRPPQPISFISSKYLEEPLLPPGTSEPPASSIETFPPPGPIMNPDGTFAPLVLPPLPPLFPYMSAQLAQSLHDGAKQCGTTFVEKNADLPFIPVIIDDNDLKKMTESVKTQFEETRQQNLLLYEDIIDPTWPKELREMFQPLYCKLCKLTLSSPVVARDHYKGRRHIRAAEVWIQDNPSKMHQRNYQQNNYKTGPGPISGTVKPVGWLQKKNGVALYSQQNQQQQQSFRGNNGPAAFYQNQHGFDRSTAPPPPPNNNQRSGFKRTAGGDRIHQTSEFIPAYRAALAPPGPGRKKPKKEGGAGPNFGVCAICNVHHTSAVTAEQHYSGKQHKAKLISIQNGGQMKNQQYSEDSTCGNFSSNNSKALQNQSSNFGR